MPPEEAFDVVVIGSGIGGMTAARMWTEFAQKRVLVLERHYTPGGMTHEFTRADGRYHFGTGVHYLGREPDPLLNYMADGRAQYQPLPDEFDVLHFPDFDFPVPASEEKFRERLKARFPEEARAIESFFPACRRAAAGLIARNIVSSLSPIVRRLALPFIKLLYPETFQTIQNVIERRFRDPALRAILSARWGLFGPPPAVSAFGWQALVSMVYYVDGGSHPVGGPKELSRAILEALERRGVVLRARQHVHRIVLEDGRVAGVDVEDRATGRRYMVAASFVVSAVGLRNTCALVGAEAARPWERELKKLPREIATIMLFIGLKRSPREFGLRGENHWFMPDLDDEASLGLPLGEGLLYASFGSLNNPAARSHTVEVMQLIDPAVFGKWFGTEEGARPERYLEIKDRVTARLLDRLDAQWPGFKASVAFAELATPLSFMTYQNSAAGSFYGLATSPARLRSPIGRCRTHIPGLFLSGQDAWGPGIGAALWGGIMSVNAALRGPQRRKFWKLLGSRGLPAPVLLPWRGYMRVVRIENLTSAVKRIRFRPLPGGELPFTFRAGQYLRVDVPIGGGTIERAYSICSAPGARDFVEIAVKREAGGLGSPFLCDELQAGEVLRVSAPFGEFTVDFDSGLAGGRLLLITGGVGITPVLSVIAAASEAGHTGPITLLASFRTEDDVLFRDELDLFAMRLPNLTVRFFITSPASVATSTPGRIDLNALRPYAQDAARVHLCGPTAMMQEVIGALADLNVPRAAIHTEAFVSSQLRTTLAELGREVARTAGASGVEQFQIRLRSGASFPCRPGQTILSAANAARVPFQQSCNEGACGSCRTRVATGSFRTATQASFSAAEQAEGWVLACQTLPAGDLELAQ